MGRSGRQTNQTLHRERLRIEPQCRNCGSRRHLQCHHIVPVSQGGPDELDNTMTLCSRCHKYVHVSGVNFAARIAWDDMLDELR